MFSMQPLLSRYSRTAATIQGGSDELRPIPEMRPIPEVAPQPYRPIPEIAPEKAPRPIPEVAPQPAGPAPPPLNKQQFREDLQALRRTNTIAIGTLVGVIVIAFVITLMFINHFVTNATAVASLFVGFGTLSTGITTAILGAFRVKAQSDLLDILSKNVDSTSLQTIIDVLSKRT